MKQLKNEQGYTLVTVLLIVTIFMILFLSFMGQGLSSAKQNQAVEKKNLSTTAAEAGIAFYQVEVQRIFESKQQTVNDIIKADKNMQGDYVKWAAIKMAEEIQKTYPVGVNQSPVSIEGDPNASFTIKNFTAAADSVNPSKVNISFNIVGTENKKDSVLFAKMTIDLKDIQNIYDPNDPNNYVIPNFNTVVNNKNISTCKDLSCNNVYIEGNGSFNDNNSMKDNQVIYVTGNLVITGNGNENNNTNTQIHADGYINIGKNMNSQSNVFIETKDSATFGQNLNMTGKSNLIVYKNLTINQNFQLANNSYSYVGGGSLVTSTPPPSTTYTAWIKQNLDILSSSTMCVNGDLTVDGKITVNTDAHLYVLGNVKENGVLKTNYKTDPLTFVKQCGKYVPTEFKLQWGSNVSTVINDVTYNN